MTSVHEHNWNLVLNAVIKMCVWWDVLLSSHILHSYSRCKNIIRQILWRNSEQPCKYTINHQVRKEMNQKHILTIFTKADCPHWQSPHDNVMIRATLVNFHFHFQQGVSVFLSFFFIGLKLIFFYHHWTSCYSSNWGKNWVYFSVQCWNTLLGRKTVRSREKQFEEV